MRTLLPLALLTTLALPLVHADAHGDCDAKGNVALGIVTLGSGRADDPVPTFYLDDRNYAQGNGVWIYQEWNGEDGLQRGGKCWFVPGDNEICYDDSQNGPDWLVY